MLPHGSITGFMLSFAAALLLLAWGICLYIRTGSVAYPRIVNYLLYAALAALLVFFFARNIAEGNFAELFSRIKAFLPG